MALTLELLHKEVNKRDFKQTIGIRAKNFEMENIQQVLDGDFEINSQTKEVVTTGKNVTRFRDNELIIMADWCNEKYSELFGRGDGPNYRDKKDSAWEELTKQINDANDGVYQRKVWQIENKIDNVKSHCKFYLITQRTLVKLRDRNQGRASSS